MYVKGKMRSIETTGRRLWIVCAFVLLSSFALGWTSCPLRLAEGPLPKVDGVISPREYDEGTTFLGFLNAQPPMFLKAGNEGTATFLSDGRTLYVAWRVKANNIDIGGGLKAKETERDGALWDDDSVELVVASEDSPARVGHFIFNPIGTVYDALYQGSGKADKTWNCKELKVASRVLHGWWELEASIPLASIGKFERAVEVNAARSVPGEGAASLTASIAYIGGAKLRLEWRKGAQAVGMLSIGNPAQGEWRPEFVLSAGDSPVRAEVQLNEVRDNGGLRKSLFADGKVLNPGEKFMPTFNTRSRALLHAKLTMRDARTGAILLERSFDARRSARSAGVPPSAEFDLGEIGEVSVYHYPGMNRIRFTCHPAPGAAIASVRCVLAGRTSELAKEGGAFTALMETPAETGKYPVAFTVCGADGKETAFRDAWTLEKRHFEWEGNRLGCEKIILPPFKPIAADGDTLKVVMRKYALGAAGLPRSISALGREMLAAPVHLEAVVSGKTEAFEGASPRIEVKDSGYSAQIAATAGANGLTIENRANFEYDGFLWNEMRLGGLAGRSLDRLTLVVPLKDAEVPLMHICTTDSIRYNPTGAVPPGDGVVWDGTKLHRKSGFVDDMFAPQCVPYVWLGAERRGLCWFINNTAGLSLAPDRPSVRIVRRKDVLRLEIDLVNTPSRLKDGHAFAFGFEATPVKEQDKSMWRHFQTGTTQCPEGMVPRHEVSYLSCGFWNCWARRPYNDDWTLFKLALAQANTGKRRVEYDTAFTVSTNRYDAALEDYAAKLPSVGKQTYFDWITSCRYFSSKKIREIDTPGYPFKYSDPTLNWMNEESEEYYKSEWISRGTGYMGATRNFLVPSYLDYTIYYYHKEISLGLKGLYFDDMFPMTCRNPDTSMSRDEAGNWHGNFGILEMRELVKRAAVMQHLAGVRPRLIQIHMTNCLLVPSFAFGTSMLSWEDHFGEEIFQKRFAVDYMRAESLGTQVGAEAVALDGIRRIKWDEKDWRRGRFRFLTRTQQALLLPAGVKIWLRPAAPYAGVDREELFSTLAPLSKFEIWRNDCTFKAFYDDDGLVSGAPDGVLTASYRRPGKLLVLFGNSTEKDVSFKPRVARARLGLSPKAKIYDAETGEPIKDGVVSLKGWDLAMLLYTTEKPPTPPGTPVVFAADGKGGVKGWTANPDYKPLGQAEAVDWRSFNGMRIKPQGARLSPFYTTDGLDVRPGDRLRFSMRVKGVGEWGAGVYQYKSRKDRAWRGASISKSIAVAADRAKPVSFTVKVGDDATFVRPVLEAHGEDEMTFFDLHIAIER